ncbi:Leukocyte cell-derived chemotaxin 1 [Plecturocebus cupreus]
MAQAGPCTVRARGAEMPCTSGQRDGAQNAREVSECLAPPAATMAENSDKVPIALVGPDDVELCSPPTYATVTVKPSSPARLLKVGAAVLISGAVLLLFGAIGAFYFWKGSDSHIYNVHYTMSINGKLQDGSMEIDAGNNLETFKMGSGAEEAIEVNDFQNGITGIRFAGGEKCYIKAQVKARIPEVGSVTKQSISSELEGKIMPVKYEENSLIWVAVDQPVKDNSFLSSKVLELCGNLPIFWLKPTYPKEIQRERREVVRTIVPTTTRRPRSGPQGSPGAGRLNNETRPSVQEDSQAFNPDNPYHQQEGESMTFDPRLDHEGICCIECRRSYTHCQKICEPLGGYYPWPYNYQGCRSACRVIMPCSWWVARILGMV